MMPILLALFILLALGLFSYILVQKKKIRRLTNSIDDFLYHEKRTPLSTRDDSIGHLQTEIYELQSRLLQERSNIQEESKSNQEFISDISHQLKTPLAGLRLYCEMEDASCPSPHTEKELELIEKMESLIQNVLKLEKLRGDAYEMEFTPCDISKLAMQIRGELQPLFPRKSIEIEGQAELRMDPDWFREALENLMKNACEHTQSSGSVHVRIEPGETSVSITVEDNGGGVEEAELPRLFDRFHRTANATPSSAGIGLAITKAIVQKHHGTILARNGNEGLQIIMCLPVIDANEKI